MAGGGDEAVLAERGDAADDDYIEWAAVLMTCVVQVVQPGVWPAVLCAVRVVPPSWTVLPLWRVRSTWAAGKGLKWAKSVRPPVSMEETSASMTMYFACVCLRISALPPAWSEWAWLMRRILMSEKWKPSCSMLWRICGGEEVRLELMRMSPAGVVMR